MGSVKTTEFEGKEYRAGRSLAGQPGEVGKLVFVEHEGDRWVFRDTNNFSYNCAHYEAVPVPLTTITETTTKEIKAPAGYEFESGEKRQANIGEYYLDNGRATRVPDCYGLTINKYYILRKIKKGPRTFYAAEYVDGIGLVEQTKAEAEENARRVGSSIGIVKLIEVLDE